MTEQEWRERISPRSCGWTNVMMHTVWVRCVLIVLCMLQPSFAWAGVLSMTPTTVVDEAVGISYRFHVAEQSGAMYGKILFLAHSLYHPDNCTGTYCPQHQVEAIISNSTHAPQVGDCCWDGVEPSPGPPTCALYNAAPFSGLKIGAWIGDQARPAGLWMSDASRWPRRALGIDGSLTDYKLEATYQHDITGLDGTLTWRRGAILSPEDSRTWGRACLPMSMARPMRQWHVDVAIGEESVQGTVIYPDDEATHLRPDRLIEFVTEFFELPGVVRIFIWDIVALSAGDGRIPLRDFQIVSRHPGIPTGLWGVRLGEHRGASVIEFGTDPQQAYVSEPGSRITLPMRPVSIPALSGVWIVAIIVIFVVALAHHARP